MDRRADAAERAARRESMELEKQTCEEDYCTEFEDQVYSISLVEVWMKGYEQDVKKLKEAGFSDVYFMPASSDAGTSLGAALYVAHVLGDDQPVEHAPHDYLGPHVSDEEIASSADVQLEALVALLTEALTQRDAAEPALA